MFEAKLATQLNTLGCGFSYETLVIEYMKKGTYTPDFILPNGIIIEAKGVWVPEDRKKHLLVKEQHPELEIRMVFQNANNKIRKGSKTTYGMWCDKKNIKWSNKVIPSSWLSNQHTYRVPSAGRVTLDPLTKTEAQSAFLAALSLEDNTDSKNKPAK
tara:strand:- start:4982 stop:5452 length:471 start_codon:yes stop_codon:yes gene_type:complete